MRPKRTLPDLLPYDTPAPADPRRRPWALAARIAAYVAILGAITASLAQYQYLTVRNLRRAAAFDANWGHLTPRELEEANLEPPKEHVGAIARWRPAVRQFWDPNFRGSSSIYRLRDPNVGGVFLHPNMPFTVMLLTPFTWLDPATMSLVLGILKLAVILAAVGALVRVAGHDGLRMPDWVVLLGVFWALQCLMGDIRHGNTNIFVLGAIALHLWLYRRGRDLAAGASLALAVCLKMTPALFGLYWLYQRNWRLLAGLAVALAIFAVAVPAAALGPGDYQGLMHDWLGNLIMPGLVEGAWYPTHMNQSLPGTVGRYVLGGPGGNYLWSPDDRTYDEQLKERGGRWINFISLSPQEARWLVRVLQAAVVALMAWAIGWRKLPRDDGRRMLHYSMVVLGMLILNQRTWDHHAAVLPVTTIGVWYALGFGRLGPKARWAGLLLVLAALPITQLAGLAGLLARVGVKGGKAASAAAEAAADTAEAYGPRLLFLLLMLAAAAVLSLALKKAQAPYAAERQKLGHTRPAP